jgi:hypothetical protein
MSGNESIYLGIIAKAPKCPESWWATPGLTRDQFNAKQRERLTSMKAIRQTYGRIDGVDAQ